MKILTYLFIFFFSISFVHSQNTVGLISYQPDKSYDGYNLVYPHNQSTVYLLDNCGQIAHSWTDSPEFRPGNGVYLLENGDLIKTKRRSDEAVNDRIWAGGGGSVVELRDWDNDLIASFQLNNDTARLHHDIAALPNGNILMIAWEIKDSLTALQAGRNPELMSQGEVWSEMILEWNPLTDEIVWEWHVWDHLVQEFNNETGIDNLGKVSSHPELININYDEHDGHPDWLHINAIDYNPVLDQIILSIPYFNEIWIIDHSTTKAEAASHTGGNAGKGGDLLFRWGNPAAYNQGDASNKKLFFQHNVQWVNPKAIAGTDNYGLISCFNNRVGANFSTLTTLQTITEDSYQLEMGTFLPSTFETVLSYPDTTAPRAHSVSLSSVQVLPNNNFLALSGRWGFAYELTPNSEIVWEYLVPIKDGAIVNQGDTLSITNNVTFHWKRYGLEYEGLLGRDVTPKGYLELNPNEAFCEMLVDVEDIPQRAKSLKIYPNPAQQMVTIASNRGETELLQLFNLDGRLLKQITVFQNTRLDIQDLPAGVYLLRGEYGQSEKLMVY